MPTNNDNLTPEQRQRAEALSTAARIVAGSGPVFGPSPGVPEDRTFDVQEYARWIVKGDDDGAPAEDRHAAHVGPIHAHGPEDGDPEVIRRLQEAARATGYPADPREAFDRLKAGDHRFPGFRYGGVIHHGETENAGTAPEDTPEGWTTPVTFEGRTVGHVDEIEETDDGVLVRGTIGDQQFAATMGDHVPGLSVREVANVESFDAETLAKAGGETFAERMTRLLVETGPTAGDDDVEDDPAAAACCGGDGPGCPMDGPQCGPVRDHDPDGDSPSAGPQLAKGDDGVFRPTGTLRPTDGSDGPDDDAFEQQPGAVAEMIDPPGSPGTGEAVSALGGNYRIDRPEEFRAGYGVEPDRTRVLRRITEAGAPSSFLRYYEAKPGFEHTNHGRAGWALGGEYARRDWHDVPAGYGTFRYADA